ncbi:MAG: prealbumin-like fold domain-containing protein [Anaerococcus sp.]|nr:prealbumin-like fold domain-containing protein [Anaerococcus sp.]
MVIKSKKYFGLLVGLGIIFFLVGQSFSIVLAENFDYGGEEVLAEEEILPSGSSYGLYNVSEDPFNKLISFKLNGKTNDLYLLLDKDIRLFEDKTYQSYDLVHLAYERLYTNFKAQGLEIDVEIAETSEGYYIENIFDQEEVNLGETNEDFEIYHFKIMEEDLTSPINFQLIDESNLLDSRPLGDCIAFLLDGDIDQDNLDQENSMKEDDIGIKLSEDNESIERTNDFDEIEPREETFPLTIISLDDLDNPIENVRYCLSFQGEEVLRATSDNKGELIFDGLKPGDYLLDQEEIEKPFIESLKDFWIRIDDNGFAKFLSDNEQTDPAEDSNFTEGKSENENLIEDVEVNWNGLKPIFNLDKKVLALNKFNEPDLKEEDIRLLGLDPDFYRIRISGKQVDINPLGDPREVNRLTIINPRENPLASFQVQKIDSKSKKPLSYARFTLINNENQIIVKGYTKADGIVKFEDLSPGTYTLEEIKSPINYEKTMDYWEVKVGQMGEVQIFEYQKLIDLEPTNSDLSAYLIMNNKRALKVNQTITKGSREDEFNLKISYEKLIDFDKAILDIRFLSSWFWVFKDDLSITYYTLPIEGDGSIDFTVRLKKISDDDNEYTSKPVLSMYLNNLGINNKDGYAAVKENKFYSEPKELILGEGNQFTVENKRISKKPDLTIKNLDKDDNPIEGSIFGVENLDDPYNSFKISTNEKGRAKFTYLSEGVYRIYEVSPANGYSPNNKSYDLIIDSGGNIKIDGNSLVGDPFVIRSDKPVAYLPQTGSFGLFINILLGLSLIGVSLFSIKVTNRKTY